MIVTKRMRAKQLEQEAAEAFDFAHEVQRRRLTQDQAAEVLHVTQATISRWMKGRPVPKAYRTLWILFWENYDRSEVQS